jgi:hypothetical protein
MLQGQGPGGDSAFTEGLSKVLYTKGSDKCYNLYSKRFNRKRCAIPLRKARFIDEEIQ